MQRYFNPNLRTRIYFKCKDSEIFRYICFLGGLFAQKLLILHIINSYEAYRRRNTTFPIPADGLSRDEPQSP